MFALNASLAKHCSPEVFRLIEVLGLSAALKLMLTLPGVKLEIPPVTDLPESINLANASMAVLKKKMEEPDAALHYQVSLKELRSVVYKLREYYRTRAKKMANIRKVSIKGEVDLMFKRLSRGDLQDF